MRAVSLKTLSYKEIIKKDLTGTEFNIRTGYLLVNSTGDFVNFIIRDLNSEDYWIIGFRDLDTGIEFQVPVKEEEKINIAIYQQVSL